MKRFLLWTLMTLVAALAGGFAVAGGWRAAALRPVAATELADVTGGVCFVNCKDDEDDGDEEPEPPRLVATEWRPIGQTDSRAEQLSYSIYTELSNVSGDEPLHYSVNVSDQCRFKWITGGVGISSGFNIMVGRTYNCAVTANLSGQIKPGYRLKVYKGEMRQYSTITVAEYLIYSDGSERESGSRDVGRRERRWSRFHPVQVYGN